VVEEALGSDISVDADMSWKDALARLAGARKLKPKSPKTFGNLRFGRRAFNCWRPLSSTTC
jgi:hypothetical protein